jgi:hypothetical protein
VRNGLPELAALVPLNYRLFRLLITSSVWEARTRDVTLVYHFLNIPRDSVIGPLKLRITDVGSDLGPATLRLPTGESGRPGTVIDLSTALPSGGLPPGGRPMPCSYCE